MSAHHPHLPRSSWLASAIASTTSSSEAWEALQHDICVRIHAHIASHAHRPHVRQVQHSADSWTDPEKPSINHFCGIHAEHQS